MTAGPDGGFDCRDPLSIDTPRMFYAHLGVEIPEGTTFAGLRDQRPGDDGAAQLRVGRVTGMVGRLASVRVMVQKLPIGRLAELGIPCSTED